jgi:hypothetical protein
MYKPIFVRTAEISLSRGVKLRLATLDTELHLS